MKTGAGTSGRVWARRGLQAVLTVAVTWFIFRRIGVSLEDLAAVPLSEWRPSLFLLLLASVVLAAGYFVSASLWGRMVVAMGGPRLGEQAAWSVFFTANLGRYIPGKVWQIAGLAFLARRRGVPGGLAAGAAVVGQGVGLLGATLVGATALFAGAERVRTVGSGALIVLGVFAIIAAVPPAIRAGIRLLFRVAGRDPDEAPALGPGFAFRWIVLYGLNWVLYAAAFWLLSLSFGLAGAVWEVGPAFAAAYVLGYLAVFAPAGIGVREGFLVGFLEPLLGTSAALALALSGRVWTTVIELLPAGYFASRELRGPLEEAREPTPAKRADGQDEEVDRGHPGGSSGG